MYLWQLEEIHLEREKKERDQRLQEERNQDLSARNKYHGSKVFRSFCNDGWSRHGQHGCKDKVYKVVVDKVEIEIKADSSAHSGFQGAHTLALFSDSASVNYEIIFIPT